MREICEGDDPREAVIASELYDERWYGDGPPHWIISAGTPFEKPSQTAAQARDQREESVKRMHPRGSSSSNEPHVPHLIRSNQSCRPHCRCSSGACAECQRALQRWIVANIHQTAAPLLNTTALVLVSLVPDYAATSPTCPKLKWEKVIARLCEDMASVGIPWAIGGSDFSVNIDKVVGGDPVLQGQFWLLIEKPKGHWKARLKPLINSSGVITRPVTKSEYKGSKAQLAYAIKNRFNQRNSFIKSTNPLRNPNTDTRGKKLRRDHWLNLMLFLHHIDMEGRLIDHNVLSCNARGRPQVSLGGIPNANHETAGK